MGGFALVSQGLPRARQHRSQVYRDTVEQFVGHGLDSGLVELDRKQDAAYSGLREAIADLGYGELVRVSRRGGSLYLVRTRGGSAAPEA